MAIRTNSNYRLKRSAEQEERMKYLIQELKVFHSYQQVLMISAIVGFNNNAFCPIKTSASDSVQIITIPEKDLDIIDFIAFAYKKSQSVLNGDEKYAIFESFANGGFPILVDKLGVDFVDKGKNDRLSVMKKLFVLLLRRKL